MRPKASASGTSSVPRGDGTDGGEIRAIASPGSRKLLDLEGRFLEPTLASSPASTSMQ